MRYAESSKSAPKSSKKGAKSTKTGGKSAKSAGEGCSNVGEGSSKSQPSKSPQTSPKTPQTSPKWTKKKIMDAKKSIPVCGFRLWASWMHNEHSFQIKSLHDDHKCSRNYKLGSLVTYKWIAYNFSKEIINDPFIPYIKMRDQIRQKFLIDVSLGQCKRAKQRALYNHEGGLIKHYGRLWDYRQALLESNPGSTCRLEVEGILEVHTLRDSILGELLTTMGRDANNQMYPIAWAVVKVENIENWSWFLSLLHDDLNLQQGTGLTLILDSQEVWARTYQHFIRLVPGTNLWKRTNNQPPLPPIVRKMPERPRKKRVKAVGENNSQVTRLSKQIRCSNCHGVGHNKASSRGSGRGSRGGGRGTIGAESGGRGPMDAESGGRGTMGAESGGRGGMGSGIVAMSTDSGGRGGGRCGGRASMGGARGRRGRSRGRRGGGRRGRKGGGRGSTSGLKLMEEDDIRQSMEDEYMQGLLDEQEDIRQKQEKEHQYKLDEEALQQSREEEHMFKRIDIEREREEQQWEAMLDPLNDYRFPDQEESMDPINFMVNTQESVTQGPSVQLAASVPASVQAAQSEPAFAEGLSVQHAPSVPASDNASKKKRKRIRSEPDVPFRIYHKNRGRSERIRNMQEKKFKFDAQGTGSTAEKAFDVTP
ncbi:hypothetical protein Tco_0646460 [Tanacetum coccineum]